MTRVAVLYGGISAEREVSLSSGAQVIAALRAAGYEVMPIEVGADIGAVLRALVPPPDAVFNALHGRFGEDGTIQGLLDWLGIPYTHSGVRASALAIDKIAAKALFREAGLPVAHGRLVDMVELEAADPLPLPYVIKPFNEGSSVGVEIMREGGNRRAEVARTWRFGKHALVEEYVPGRELTVGVMGERPLLVTEIMPSVGFYDYEAKYADGGSQHVLPARVHPADARPRARRGARRASRARLPRRLARRFPLRRHRGRARTAGAAGGEHAARPHADLAAARAGGASRHGLPGALRLDGGERAMPRVKSPRTVERRPPAWRLLLRRQKRLLRPLAWGVAGFAVVLAATSLVHEVRPGSTLSGLRERLGRAADMRVSDIMIEGRANTPEPLLRAALGVSRGDPILGFSVRQARQRIETLSSVEHVSVERRLPGTIVVALTERRPFAVWQHDGKFQLIGRDGQVVADQSLANYAGLPLVVGDGAPAHAASLLDLLATRPAIQSRVVAMVRVGDRRWNLDLKNGTEVLLPEGAEPAAIARLAELESAHALLDRPLAVVDLRLPDRLVLRPHSEPAPAAGTGVKRPT